MLCVEIKLFCSGNEHPISSLIRRTLVEVNATDCPSHEIAYLYGKYEPDTIAEIAKAMGKDAQYIRVAIQKGLLKFGVAMKMDNSSEFSYYCPDRKVWEETGYFRDVTETRVG